MVHGAAEERVPAGQGQRDGSARGRHPQAKDSVTDPRVVDSLLLLSESLRLSVGLLLAPLFFTPKTERYSSGQPLEKKRKVVPSGSGGGASSSSSSSAATPMLLSHETVSSGISQASVQLTPKQQKALDTEPPH